MVAVLARYYIYNKVYGQFRIGVALIFCPFSWVLHLNAYFFEKSYGKIWWNRKNVVPLHSQFRNDA